MILVPSCFSICLEGTKATISSLNDIVAPLSTISVRAVLCSLLTANFFSYLSHGFSVVCLWPRLNLRPSTSNSRTITSILSPRLNTSEGCLTFFVQDKSEI